MEKDKAFKISLAVFMGFLIIITGIAIVFQQSEDIVEVADTTESEDVTEKETEAPTLSEKYLTRNERITICIDAGHGGSETGATSGDYVEKKQNLELSLLIRDYLLQYDVEVIMTRETDIDMTKNDRVFMANENYADVLVSIHRNYFAGSAAYGFEVWIGQADKAEDRRLAELIIDNISQVEGTYIRGLETGSTTDRNEDYIINRHSLMPSCIVEMGFISNKSDNELFINNKEEYAKLIAEAILTFLEVDLGDKKNDE